MHFQLSEIFNAQEQYKSKSFLSQATVDSLFFWSNFSIKSPENRQELWSDPASTALYTDTSGTTDWVSVLHPPHETVHEIECRLVGFARSFGDHHFKGAQDLSSKLPLLCPGTVFPSISQSIRCPHE